MTPLIIIIHLQIGLAFACNFGGMASPIASLQNIVAVATLSKFGIDISFGQWLLVALPLSVIGVVLCWLYIIVRCTNELSHQMRMGCGLVSLFIISMDIQYCEWFDSKVFFFIDFSYQPHLPLSFPLLSSR